MFYRFTLPLAFGLLIVANAHAELYKKVDEQGNVTYSDVPSGAAKPVKPPGLSTYGTPPQHKQVVKKPADTTPSATTNYTTLTIVSPVNDEALRDNSGMVMVKVNVEPKLDIKSGHKLVLLLDQKSAATVQSSEGALEVALNEVDRGTHALKAQITEANGGVLKESAEIIFQLHRGPGAAGRKAGK